MFEIQNSDQVFDEYYMNSETIYYLEDDVNIALPSNEFYYFNTLFVTRYVNEASVSYSGEYENRRDTLSDIALPSNDCYINALPVIRYDGESSISYEDTLSVVENVNVSGGGSSEHEIEDIEDGTSEGGDSENEPKDSSLKEIHTWQTFTSFEVLEQCLKRYSIRMGFETKIVRAEKENDDFFSRKSYKCRHEGKYLPKKKLDPTTNRER
ncbi:18866_t:CDS:2, partial [Racocetra fulgida]